MSDEHKSPIGPLAEDYAAAKIRLSTMRANARRHAEAMGGVSSFILSAHASAFRNQIEKCNALPLPGDLSKLMADIAEEAERVANLGKELKSLGLDVNEDVLGPLKPPRV